MSKKEKIEKDLGAEAKIKAAAKKLFTQNGFEATRTRDIAEEAGINLALLNYYFRSKQKLFEIVMRENVTLFVGSILEGMHNKTDMSLDEKLELFVDKYIDMLIENPDLPFFMLNISRSNKFSEDDPIAQSMKEVRSTFLQLLGEHLQKDKTDKVHPLHIMANMMGLMAFPFASANMLRYRLGNMSREEFERLMIERKKLIPIWLKAMFSN